MKSASIELFSGPSAPDLILRALLQSRLHERSLYLGKIIQSQQRAGDAESPRLRLAEQALAAVQEAKERMGRGGYGMCDHCKEPIGLDELLEAPEQACCRGCSGLGAPQGVRVN